MTAIISAITSLVTAAAGWVTTWVGTMFNTVVSDGVSTTTLGFIGFFAIIPLVGLGVGLLRRLLSVN